ncbi:MAG: phosphotransferase [Pseudomonadota bacterium]|nr:phosphotransferase [Pseudomonadota bacterium]
MTPPTEPNRRDNAAAAWLSARVSRDRCRIEPIPGDASNRRYFRVHAGEQRFVLMDAPPALEDCAPFVAVAKLLLAAGLNAPRIIAADLDQGFLLLSDLGTQSYLDVLGDASADTLMAAAIEALVTWQAASRPGALPPYDADLLRRELDLFPDWYLGCHLGLSLKGDLADAWEALCKALIDAALAQPRVFVHRDYMPRNLLVSEPPPGIIDFQDAVIGPVTYDLVSLLRDAFISWSDAQEQRWIARYRQQAAAAGIPLPADSDAFLAAFDLMGMQRHLKVLGIFARLNYRDGKPRYLAEAPRFIRYLETAAARHDVPGLSAVLQALSPANR